MSTKGQPRSPETRAKISASKMGKRHSDETRAKMSAGKKGKSTGPKSPETRAKMSAAKKGVPKSPEHRAAMCLAQQKRYARERQEKQATRHDRLVALERKLDTLLERLTSDRQP